MRAAPGLVLIASVIWGTVLSAQDQISIGAAPEIGPANAAVTLVEFVDLSSEPSRRLAFMLKALGDSYPAQVRVVFKHDPDESNAPAWLAHQAALAAGEQSKFWEMSDLIFSNQNRLERNDLVGMARQLGLDTTRFQSDLDSGAFRAPIDRDRQEAASLSNAHAPLCLLNGQLLALPTTAQTLKALVDKALTSTAQPK